MYHCGIIVDTIYIENENVGHVSFIHIIKNLLKLQKQSNIQFSNIKYIYS